MKFKVMIMKFSKKLLKREIKMKKKINKINKISLKNK